VSVTTAYQWLEPKPHKKRTRQLGIKGRNMLVWHLVAPVVVQGREPQEVADSFDLPLEAVQEALDYFAVNRAWIEEELEASARRLGLR
jgi:uncharacterized protein (DUF433 family)